jgi:uncharacterized protein YeaO (DUF488 family)
MIQIKRAYDPPGRDDGHRFLVERLWPRGMKKEALAYEAWLKDVAPSTALRQWYGHRLERWEEFRRRYQHELDAHPDAWQPIIAASRHGTVTLLFSAHDSAHSGAAVLRDYLSRGAPARNPPARSARARGARRRSAPADGAPAGRRRSR